MNPYQQAIESALLSKATSSSLKLQEVCNYALLQGGKRFRPALVLMVAKALNATHDIMDAALAVEYFHTASLIADDLPCMDNDQERRGKPATHIVYGESLALLASYALIAEGYQLLAQNAKNLPFPNNQAIGILAIENVSYNTGILGATGGQYLDLFPPTIDEATYRETILKKTVALFEISFVIGWLFGGGDPHLLPTVKKASYHFGMAFQIADDIDDYTEDAAGKRLMNAVSLFGAAQAKKMVQEELKGYSSCLKELHINSGELEAIMPHC